MGFILEPPFLFGSPQVPPEAAPEPPLEKGQAVLLIGRLTESVRRAPYVPLKESFKGASKGFGGHIQAISGFSWEYSGSTSDMSQVSCKRVEGG